MKARLQPALMSAIRHPDVIKKFNEMGFEVVGFLDDDPAKLQTEICIVVR